MPTFGRASLEELNDILNVEAGEAEVYEAKCCRVAEPSAKERLARLRDEHGRRRVLIEGVIRRSGGEPSRSAAKGVAGILKRGADSVGNRRATGLLEMEERTMDMYDHIVDPTLRAWLTSESSRPSGNPSKTAASSRGPCEARSEGRRSRLLVTVRVQKGSTQ